MSDKCNLSLGHMRYFTMFNDTVGSALKLMIPAVLLRLNLHIGGYSFNGSSSMDSLFLLKSILHFGRLSFAGVSAKEV
ncbi:hypothetical protein B0H94_11614 [Salsuginibacillus halophilus]|uniref:Uncharacterized protein n=1 Tax=Salsuginibacillus halophilus TaxID=517424 RepID=A0A2P8H7Y8_9BACI|nr:hypothetical protein [Salsuginibacillus halophilus]PSL42311.1 hypothetical protein B0H94_11614 [Salsuginibacillus halophilus]